ncbi:MAG: BspA family leucine-rich repeat surface protein [Bacteroidales bacterium]|nr:BspA family leucine-rich repeat surface protein [Bacteroidales bacterium]
MRKFFASLMVAALAFTACSPKEEFAANNLKPAEDGFYATISSETRTYLEEGENVYNVYWKSGDKIRCTDDGDNSNVIYVTYDNGVKSAWFTHDPSDPTALCTDSTKFWAYYPSTLRGKTLPATQQYAPNGLAAAPMRGYYEKNEGEDFKPSFEFKHLAGAVKLNITTSQSDIKVSSIVLRADKGLSGSYSASNEEPAAVMSSETAPVTLDCPDVAIGSEAVPFFISIPASTYYAFEITILTSDGRTQTRSLKAGESITVNRAEVLPIDLSFNDLQKPTVGATATFTIGSEMNAAIKGLVNPDVSNHSDDDSTVTRMVFVTGSDAFSAVNIASKDSESPIYVFYDEATTTITVSTPAPKFVMNANSRYFFHRFKALTEIEGIDDFDSSNVENMGYFWGYSPLLEIKMPASWDYGSVTNLEYMFTSAKAEKIDLSGMEFTEVTTMKYMFGYTANLVELVWPDEVEAVSLEIMESMFEESGIAEVDLTMFKDTDNLQRLTYMFYKCPNIHKVKADFVMDNVTNVAYMFQYACENVYKLDMTEFGDVSTLTILGSMFRTCYAYELDISNWDTTENLNLRYTFHRMKNLTNLYLGPDFARTSSAVDIYCMFGGSADTTENATGSTSNVLNIYTSAEQMEWLDDVVTLCRLHNGQYTGTPLTVNFYDSKTGVTMTPSWAE